MLQRPIHGPVRPVFALSCTACGPMATMAPQSPKFSSPHAQTTRPWACMISDRTWRCRPHICWPARLTRPRCIRPRRRATLGLPACTSPSSTQTTRPWRRECTTRPFHRRWGLSRAPMDRRIRMRSLRPCRSRRSSLRRLCSMEAGQIRRPRRTHRSSTVRRICRMCWAI